MTKKEIESLPLETEEDLKVIFDVFIDEIQTCRRIYKDEENLYQINKKKYLKDFADHYSCAGICLRKVIKSKFNDEDKKRGLVFEMEKEYESINTI